MAKEELTQIMKTQTEIQAVNPKDSMLMIPKPSGTLSKTGQLDILKEIEEKRRKMPKNISKNGNF